MTSSLSSIRLSSSDSLLPDGEASAWTLPNEPDIAAFSGMPANVHPVTGPRLGESSIIELIEPLRDGIAILFWVMIGEESGDDSASVEWCNVVQAREKSRPREWRGNEVAGEP